MSLMIRYLLDTDMCIYLLNGDPRVKARVAAIGVETIAVAILTKGELYFGAYNSTQVESNLQRIQTFFASPGPQILSIDDETMKYFGQFKAELRRTGQPIGDIDLLIAGVAIRHGLTLITNKTKHFQRISGITLENWLAVNTANDPESDDICDDHEIP